MVWLQFYPLFPLFHYLVPSFLPTVEFSATTLVSCYIRYLILIMPNFIMETNYSREEIVCVCVFACVCIWINLKLLWVGITEGNTKKALTYCHKIGWWVNLNRLYRKLLGLKYWPQKYLQLHIQSAVDTFMSRSDKGWRNVKKNCTWIWCLDDMSLWPRRGRLLLWKEQEKKVGGRSFILT